MKKLIAVLCIAVVFVSCGEHRSKTIQSFIPGLYVKEIRQEFAIGMDTIFIDLLDRQASSYKIIRKSSYQQMIDGKMLTPKKEVHNWIAYFDETRNQLIEPNNERVFTFLPDKNMLLMGSSQYQKISSGSKNKQR